MKTYAEIIAGLPEEDRNVIIADREQAVQLEKSKGITAAQNARNNVSKLLSRKEEMEAALAELGIDTESEQIVDSIRELKKKGGKESPEWKTEMTKLTKQLEAFKAEAQAEKDKNLQLRKSSAITKAASMLNKKVYAHEEIAKTLFLDGKISVKDDGSVVYVADTGELDLEKGLSEYIKTRADIAINTTNGGSGSSGGNGGGQKKTMAQAEWNKLDPKVRAEFITSGGELT